MLYPVELLRQRANGRVRTGDLLLGKQILYQLSYIRVMGVEGFEPTRVFSQRIYSPVQPSNSAALPLQHMPSVGVEPTKLGF